MAAERHRPTCKDLNRRLRAAIRAEVVAAATNRVANAAVAAAVEKLPRLSPQGWALDDAEMSKRRALVQPLVDRAQAASTVWFAANAELVNLRAAVAEMCRPRTTPKPAQLEAEIDAQIAANRERFARERAERKVARWKPGRVRPGGRGDV